MNLVDIDMLYGHRRDPVGYARALAEIDAALPRLAAALREGDVLVLTADHGNDPTFPGSDHTREYVPLLAYSPAAPARRRPGRAAAASPTWARPWPTTSAARAPRGKSFLEAVA